MRDLDYVVNKLAARWAKLSAEARTLVADCKVLLLHSKDVSSYIDPQKKFNQNGDCVPNMISSRLLELVTKRLDTHLKEGEHCRRLPANLQVERRAVFVNKSRSHVNFKRVDRVFEELWKELPIRDIFFFQGLVGRCNEPAGATRSV